MNLQFKDKDIPKSEDTLIPILEMLQDGSTMDVKYIINKFIDKYCSGMSEDILNASYRNANYPLLHQRIYDGITRLKRRHFVDRPATGKVRITDRGLMELGSYRGPANKDMNKDMSVKQQILDMVSEKLNDEDWLEQPKNDDLRDMKDAKKFYIQKGREAYDDFMRFKADGTVLREALVNTKLAVKNRGKDREIDALRRELFSEKYSFNKDGKFHEIIDTLAAYLDVKASNSKELNIYKPSRGVVGGIIFQNDWYYNLIEHKLGDPTSKSNIHNAIMYIKDPDSNVSMVKEDHRKNFSKRVFLQVEYNPDTFSKEIKKMFAPYNKHVKNKQNETIFYTRLLYDDEIRKLWDLDNIEPRLKINDMKQPLNQILYGPPGTGKTYATKRLAVEIVTGKSMKNSDRDDISKEYDELVTDKKIEFVTFHQSYGYEEFIEGIKPSLIDKDDDESSGDISYHIKNGIFKNICNEAQNTFYSKEPRTATPNKLDKLNITGNTVWQVKLGENDQFNNYCFSNGCIRRGSCHFPEEDLLGKDDNFFREQKDQATYRKGDVDMNRAFCLYMQPGELVVVYKSHSTICAIGILTEAGYEFLKDVSGDYAHSRSVKWLWVQRTNEHSIKVIDIKGSRLDRRSITRAHGLSPAALLERLREHINLPETQRYLPLTKTEEGEEQNNYVLIIDEINRGNISKILGELITLLEEDKRKGAKEELQVTLPYSQEAFSVPKNLYIIGTMNTADRSIAFLDTALRRRFQFKEITPDPSFASDNMEGVNVSKLLRVINNKITKHLDRDHQIGHSYFMKHKVKNIHDLSNTFINNICPLLDEYFYDRRELVLDILNDCNLLDGDKDNWEWADKAAFIDKQNYIDIYKDDI